MALQTLWFILWGLLWAVYFMLDGFDFGTAMLRPLLSKDDPDTRVMLNTVGPVWDGNEVWLITAGGATFAAFPATYAAMFSFLYLPMLLILFSLIARGVAIEFRGKLGAPRWHALWDWVMTIASLLVSFLFGLAFGNLFRGLPIDGGGYRGTFGMLWNPYGVVTGLLFVVLFAEHGAIWLAVKSAGSIAARARRLAATLWYLLLGLAVLFLVMTWFDTRLADNYLAHPAWIIVPILTVAALIAEKVVVGSRRVGESKAGSPADAGGKHPFVAFALSGGFILLFVATALIGLYPNLIPSSIDGAASLTITNSSSGPYTLRVMTIVAVIFVPIVVAYQIFVYRFFRKRVSREEVQAGGGY